MFLATNILFTLNWKAGGPDFLCITGQNPAYVWNVTAILVIELQHRTRTTWIRKSKHSLRREEMLSAHSPKLTLWGNKAGRRLWWSSWCDTTKIKYRPRRKEEKGKEWLSSKCWNFQPYDEHNSETQISSTDLHKDRHPGRVSPKTKQEERSTHTHTVLHLFPLWKGF